MKTSVTLNAYAKINLFLDVISKRADGYHNIDSIMQSVSLCDTVTVTAEPADKNEIMLTCTAPVLPCDSKNLAYRAAELFLDTFSVAGYRIGIHVEKRIPIAAGLAGGSTDAASVLDGMAQLFNIPKERLFPHAKKLGADVPFCLAGKTMRTEGIGEVLTPVHNMPNCVILIGRKGEGVSTPVAFSELDAVLNISDREKRHGDINAVISALEKDVYTLSGTLYNSFHDMILARHSEAEAVANIIKSSGALAVQLSGSGPSVFGLYDDADVAKKAASRLIASGAEAFVTEPIGR